MTVISRRCSLRAAAVTLLGLRDKEGGGQGQSQWTVLAIYHIVGMARMPMAASTEDAGLDQELGF